MKSVIVFLAITLAPALAHAGAGERVPPRDPVEIYGGQLAGTCQWPSTVALVGDTAGCTGTIVHPELIVTASHCLEHGSLTTAVFGEDVWSPAREAAIAECVQHPNYALDYPDYTDFMYCRLAQPVLDVPIVPILMGCETEGVQPGANAVLAGYGFTEAGNDYGTKRWVTTAIEWLEDTRVFFVGGTGLGTCDGDSGGPAFLELADGSWRVFGTTTGGPDCGDWGQSELIHLFVPWVEEQTGLDITPCHDADGTWSPSADCGGFPAEPDVPHGSWNSMCSEGPVTGTSTTCELEGGTDDGGSDGGSSSDGSSSDGGGDDDDSGDVGTSTGGDDPGGGPVNDIGPGRQPRDEPVASRGCSCSAGERSPFPLALVVLVVLLRLKDRRAAGHQRRHADGIRDHSADRPRLRPGRSRVRVGPARS